MKIKNIIVTPVNLRENYIYVWSPGVNEGFSRCIVQVETNEGITGLGETLSVDQGKMIEAMAPTLIGLNPLDIAEADLRLMPEWKTASITRSGAAQSAFGALDMAMWDIKAKALGIPLYMLFGGAYRKEIKFAEYFSFNATKQVNGEFKRDKTIDQVVEYCLKMKEEHGSYIFEGKVGNTDNYWNDINLVKKLRKALGQEATIRLDANYGYSLPTALTVLKHIEECDVRNIEDPVVLFEHMAELKKWTRTSISTHDHDLRRAITVGGPDNFCIHPVSMGGMMNTIRFIGACEEFGKGVWFYSGDSGVATALYMHFTAAFQHLSEPSQSLLRWLDNDVIEGGPFRPEKNVVMVPEKPGLGVTIDKEALAFAHKDFVENGPISYDYNFADKEHFIRLPLY